MLKRLAGGKHQMEGRPLLKNKKTSTETTYSTSNEVQMQPLPDLSLSVNYQEEAKHAPVKKINGVANRIRFLTQNVAMFPREEFDIPIPQINKDVLAPNAVRNPFIEKHILELNPDVFALQEVWDKESAAEYIKIFGEKGYHCVHGGMGVTIIDGGIMLFSKFPILEHKIIVFDNPAANEEAWARKRAICAKLQVSDEHFITVETHHLYGGAPEESSKLGGTSSYRRGTSLGQIVTGALKEKNDWWHQPPKKSWYQTLCGTAQKPLKYLKGFVMGDFNMSLDIRPVQVQTAQGPETQFDNRKRLSVSLGMSGSNGFEPNDIKYEGQRQYFSELEPLTASNSIEPRQDCPDKKGAGKQRVDKLVEEAQRQQKFTGTDRNELKDFALHDGTVISGKSDQGASRTIDGIYPVKPRDDSEKIGDFDLRVVSLDGEVTPAEAEKLLKSKSQDKKEDAKSNENVRIASSDHFGLLMDWNLDAPYKERKSIYEGSVPKPTDRENPAIGERTRCFEKLTKKKVLVSKLFPSVTLVKENKEKACDNTPKLFTVRL